jgi:SecD/SecF fusion protein
MKNLLVLLLLALVGCVADATKAVEKQTQASQPSVQTSFQMRLVLDAATSDSERKRVHRAGETNAPIEYLDVQKLSLMDHQSIKSVSTEPDGYSGRPTIKIELTPEGAKLLAAISQQNIRKRIAVLVDDQVVFAPTVMAPLLGGAVVVTGLRTEGDAKELAAKISAGLKK